HVALRRKLQDVNDVGGGRGAAAREIVRAAEQRAAVLDAAGERRGRGARVVRGRQRGREDHGGDRDRARARLRRRDVHEVRAGVEAQESPGGGGRSVEAGE